MDSQTPRFLLVSLFCYILGMLLLFWVWRSHAASARKIQQGGLATLSVQTHRAKKIGSAPFRWVFFEIPFGARGWADLGLDGSGEGPRPDLDGEPHVDVGDGEVGRQHLGPGVVVLFDWSHAVGPSKHHGPRAALSLTEKRHLLRTIGGNRRRKNDGG